MMLSKYLFSWFTSRYGLYGLQLLHVPRVLRLSDCEEVLTGAYLESGMPYVGLADLWHYPLYVVMVVIKMMRSI